MRSQSMQERYAMLLAEIAPELAPADTAAGLVDQLAPALEAAGTAEIWLALCVLKAEFPVRDEIVAARRAIHLGGASEWIRSHSRPAGVKGLTVPRAKRPVRIVRETTVVDVHHTARTGLATGIQRVVRKTIAEWAERHEIVLTGWDNEFRGLRRLTADERENALYGTKRSAVSPRGVELTVPWKSRYILPELAIEDERTARIAALAEFSGNRTAVIGFDCVPLTSAETTAPGMGAAFSRNLVAVAHFDIVATISGAAAQEYEGWRSMLASAGLRGPEIREVFLPIEVGDVDDTSIASVRDVLLTDDLPMLLCVGSHEPRKNHLSVLAAAEVLWRQGREFSLVFIGGNAWGGSAFQQELSRLQDEGRPVTAISAVSDALLYSAYRLARATVFPSWNEGFGLPVAESIAAGTPVITSRYGSMAEIAEGGGALLVDPRSDSEIRSAIDAAMFDDDLDARLRAEARGRATTTWADYADAVWATFATAA